MSEVPDYARNMYIKWLIQNEALQNLSHDYFEQAHDGKENHYRKPSIQVKKLVASILAQEVVHNNWRRGHKHQLSGWNLQKLYQNRAVGPIRGGL